MPALTFRRLAGCVSILISLGAGASTARADALATFIETYIQVESKVGEINLPISGQYLSDSRPYIACLESGVDILVCTEKFHDAGAGKDLAGDAGVPSGFGLVLDAYVAYKQGDYWRAVMAFGKAPGCAFLQHYTGADICGLQDEMYVTARDMHGRAAALSGFLCEVAGPSWDAVSWSANATCEGTGFCTSDVTPLHVTLRQFIYAPHTQEGVRARESAAYGSYAALLSSLAAQATARAEKRYAYLLTLAPEAKGVVDAHIRGSVALAEKGYTAGVDAAWTRDILGRVVTEQQPKQAQYLVEGLGALAESVAARFVQSNGEPDRLAIQHCNETLSISQGLAVVDRWVARFPELAARHQVNSNQAWCTETVQGANRTAFAKGFGDYLKAHLCGSEGDGIVCEDLDGLSKCKRLMAFAGQESQCQFNAQKQGRAAAETIQADMIAHGSSLPCAIITPRFSLGQGEANLVQLQCVRPTQKRHCEEQYRKLYSELPIKVMTCSLKEEEAYVALRTRVAEVVGVLNAQFGPGAFLIARDGDPLAVQAVNRDFMAALEDSPNQDRGFRPPSRQTGFEYRPRVSMSIDGLSTPAIWNEADRSKPVIPVPVREIARTDVARPANAAARSQNVTVHPLPAGAPAAAMAAPVGLPPVPETIMPSPPPAAPPTRPQPDLRYDGELRIGGVAAAWNGVLGLNAAEATKAGGLCYFPLDYLVSNGGEEATGAFRALLTNTAVPGSGWLHRLGSLAKGASLADSGTIALLPGHNSLQFMLDDLCLVAESSETNNRASLEIMVSGDCRVFAPQPPGPATDPGLFRVPETSLR